MTESNPNEISVENYLKVQKNLLDDEARERELEAQARKHSIALTDAHADVVNGTYALEAAKGKDEAFEINKRRNEILTKIAEAQAELKVFDQKYTIGK